MRLSALVLTALAAVAARPAAAQTADTLPLKVAERQITAFNARNLDAFIALYADDAVMMEFPSNKVSAQGKAAIRARFEPLFKPDPKRITVRVNPRIVSGAFVADHEQWPAKPGQRGEAVWMYEIRGGLIRKVWNVAF